MREGTHGSGPANSLPVSLVTGGSSGIGAALTERLLAAGHRVLITGRSSGRLADFVNRVGDSTNLAVVAGDAGEPEDVKIAVETALSTFGRLDNVVANAGFMTPGDLATGDPTLWRSMVLTNVLGPALLIRFAMPALTRSRGRIILVGSVAGLVHVPSLYSVTKWAVHALAEGVRILVTHDGVGVTLVSPGATDTAFYGPNGAPPRPGGYLASDQVAESIMWAMSQPAGTDVNTMTVRTIGSQL